MIRADAPQGLLTGSVHLLTSVTAQPDLVMPVQARVFDTVSVSPMPATLKPAHIGEGREVELEYRSLDGRALALASIRDSTGVLDLKSSNCGPGCIKVRAAFKPGKVGEFGGKISARFEQRESPVDVDWNILVVPANTQLIDLGTLNGESKASSGTTRKGDRP